MPTPNNHFFYIFESFNYYSGFLSILHPKTIILTIRRFYSLPIYKVKLKSVHFMYKNIFIEFQANISTILCKNSIFLFVLELFIIHHFVCFIIEKLILKARIVYARWIGQRLGGLCFLRLNTQSQSFQ